MVSRCDRIQTWRKLKVQLGQNEGDGFFVLSFYSKRSAFDSYLGVEASCARASPSSTVMLDQITPAENHIMRTSQNGSRHLRICAARYTEARPRLRMRYELPPPST